MLSDSLRAVILGIVEGITEFLPVSSTGHMLLVKRFFGLGEGAFWDSFVVLIQLGAILAIVVIYFAKLWKIALGMFSNADDRRFVIGILVALLLPVLSTVLPFACHMPTRPDRMPLRTLPSASRMVTVMVPTRPASPNVWMALTS